MAHPLGISIRPSLLALVTLGLFGGLAGPAGDGQPLQGIDLVQANNQWITARRHVERNS